MPDYSNIVLQTLMDHKLTGMPSGEDILMPRYDGYNLSNIPSTICSLFGIPEFGEGGLKKDLQANLGGPYDRVVLLLVDALGFQLLKKLMESGSADVWQKNLKDSIFFPLTSISPSTTASALTTLWTGVGPATHGIIGYEMWVKEYGMVINNILHSAMSYQGDTGGLVRAGFNPHEFLNQPTLGAHLLKNGIEANAYMHYSIGTSGLSSMHLDQVNLHTYISESDMWVGIRNLLNNNTSGRKYVYAYWSVVDTLTHRFSLNDERIALQFKDFSRMIEQTFLEGLSPAARKRTLLILTADHGSVFTPKYSQYNLSAHPDLNAMLRIQPTCENRLAFLYLKPNMEEAVRQYFETAWPGKFSLVSSDQTIKSGLFGKGPVLPALSDRIGDLVAIAREDAYLWWAARQNPMLGRHGGLHPEEMLIPFYALPL